jgi:hypothetical protein
LGEHSPQRRARKRCLHQGFERLPAQLIFTQ